MWAVPLKANSSHVWKSILKVRPLAVKCIRKLIGNGLNTHFWYDSSAADFSLAEKLNPENFSNLSISANAKLNNYIEGKVWKFPSELDGLLRSAEIDPSAIPNPNSDFEDQSVWTLNDNGLFSLKSAYFQLNPPSSSSPFWSKYIWFKGSIPKHSLITWFACKEALKTKKFIATRGVPNDLLCLFCTEAEEDTSHLFLHCPYALEVWQKFQYLLCIPAVQPSNIPSLFQSLAPLLDTSMTGIEILFKLSINAFVWHIWMERNNRLHNNSNCTAQVTFHRIWQAVRSRALYLNLDLSSDLLELWQIPSLPAQIHSTIRFKGSMNETMIHLFYTTSNFVEQISGGFIFTQQKLLWGYACKGNAGGVINLRQIRRFLDNHHLTAAAMSSRPSSLATAIIKPQNISWRSRFMYQHLHKEFFGLHLSFAHHNQEKSQELKDGEHKLISKIQQQQYISIHDWREIF